MANPVAARFRPKKKGTVNTNTKKKLAAWYLEHVTYQSSSIKTPASTQTPCAYANIPQGFVIIASCFAF
jgi:hypothetical protein